MPQLSPLALADCLRVHMRAAKLRQTQLARELGLSNSLISKFLACKSTPHKQNLELIELYLKENGALSRLSIPKENPYELGGGRAVETPEDTSALKGMGITNTVPKGNHYVCGYLNDWEFAQTIHALMNSVMPDESKKRILGTLFQQSFPTLS